MPPATPPPYPLRELHRLAEGISLSLGRRFYWVDQADLSQQVWLAVLSATKHRDVLCREARACAFVAAKREVNRMITRSASPVSETWHRLESLQETRTVELDETHYVSAVPTPEAQAIAMQRAARVRRAAFESAQLVPFGDLAVRVVLDEEQPREVASAAGVSRKSVYKAVALLKQAMGLLLKDLK